MRIMFGALALLVATTSLAGAQSYTSKADFTAANPAASLLEDFEGVPANQRDRGLSSLTRPGISFVPGSGGQDVYVFSATPTSNEFAPGVITQASEVLTADGLEHIIGTLVNPASALGFDVLLTDVNNLSIKFLNGSTVLGTIDFVADSDPTNNYTFAGFRSAAPITGFTFDITSGPNRYDSGLDNILAASYVASVPEASTWAMLIAGLGAVGGALRRRTAKAGLATG